jgi:hypothetical protein
MPASTMATHELPPPPPTPSPGGQGPAPPPRDRAPIVVIAVALVLAVAAIVGVVIYIGDGKEASPSDGLPTTGAASGLTYQLMASDDGDPSDVSPEGVHFELTAKLTVSEREAQSGGTSMEVDVDDVVATFDGGEPAPMAVSQLQTLRIDDRGQPDVVVIVAADSSGGFFYFEDLLFPVVPPDARSEGDTWPISFEAGVPTGTGTATYEGTGELVRFEDVAGVEAAVVRNELTYTYDFTMRASEVAFLSGLGSASGGTTGVTGTGAMTLTGWVDPATGRVLRAEVDGRYDVVFRYEGYDPEVIDLEGNYPSKGTFTSSIELVPQG